MLTVRPVNGTEGATEYAGTVGKDRRKDEKENTEFLNILNQMIKIPGIENEKLVVRNGAGEVTETLDPLTVALDYFHYSNDALFLMYGFNWVPQEPYYSIAKKLAGKSTDK